MTPDAILSITSPAEGLIVYNTEAHKPVFYNGTIWMHYDGTEMLEIGYYHAGGVIFYLDGSGGGLVCTVSDQHSGIQWYNGSYTTTGATGTAIGTGQANTTTIISSQCTGSYAAQVCADYNDGTYDDWFLPSKDELNEMYINKTTINATAIANGGAAFASNIYWCSSEHSSNYAWAQSFANGSQDYGYKDYPARVRAVRAF